MGNFSSKSAKKEKDTLFAREKWKEQKREEKRKKALNPNLKRAGVRDAPLVGLMAAQAQGGAPPGPAATGAHRSYDEEALERMRHQLDHDADAFLLNNILLSVQFFENYESRSKGVRQSASAGTTLVFFCSLCSLDIPYREAYQIKSVPIGEHEHRMDEAMVLHHKHVFFADRLQDCVQEHVRFVRTRGRQEALVNPRLFVIYDNVEASEPGDTSDYSAVLDAPFYKLQIENSKEAGYVKLKKLEVLQSTITNKEDNAPKAQKSTSSSSVRSSATDSERESDGSEETVHAGKGRALLDEIKMRMKEPPRDSLARLNDTIIIEDNITNGSERRSSGPVRYVKPVAARGNISNMKNLHRNNVPLKEDSEKKIAVGSSSPLTAKKEAEKNISEARSKKSIVKNGIPRKLSGPNRELRHDMKLNNFKGSFNSNDNLGYDTGTSGYKSASSGRLNESSETESDYGYSTITDLSTPKPVEVSARSNLCKNSGVLPDECWNAVRVRATDYWSEDDEEEDAKTESDDSALKLYETHFYLSSKSFMTDFVDNFIIKLGPDLDISPSVINSALTQGASIYCDFTKNGGKIGYEVIPALIAPWPNIANPWVIRERRIIQNPRTNFNYQWPTKYMVSKTIDFGCLLIPFGFRPKRGVNSDVELQWKIIFPAAERYLESRLAHSHIRCYLFALALYKTFMENEAAKMGIDASHIKNHLFWECEDNYAKWPEDRLGETLRLFLKRFYSHFSQARFPNYFIDSCNDFKGIPKPLLLKTQRRLLDILETPVMHVLCSLQKLKYTSKDFYPQFDYYQLYQILTCKNPLRILNPNLPMMSTNNASSSESDDDQTDNALKFWDQGKGQDKQYLWKKAKQRQTQETQRRKAIAQAKKQTKAAALDKIIDRNIILPKKLETEKRRLILEFFIPHFIAMARYSDKFEATKQAIIYAEQAQRLCMLLLEEPAGEMAANDFLDIIRERLAEYQRKLVHHGGYKLLSKRESRRISGIQPRTPSQPIRRQRPRSLNNIIAQDSPTDASSAPAFTFADVHAASPGSSRNRANSVNLTVNSKNPEWETDEESQL
ncbi:hypothetical protein EVAR_5499_1 [Eumeta japonica]|uniref:Mab-21-like HhH/H2TH-like domain-containing protein n=1 Tax=Eumeta variegata TaxID=151549 RepID=A0A4C1T9T6_EUMVA|nr:hypothetical protein EVAR_5499_1 [Eumeta japonica]